jgi:large subunit ribosomal protein L30
VTRVTESPVRGTSAKVVMIMSGKTIRVTLVKSPAKRLKRHQACVAGLGLRRIGHSVEVEDTPAVRGMINRINYMVRVEGE